MRGLSIRPSQFMTERQLIFFQESCERDRQIHHANLNGPAQVVAECRETPSLPLAARTAAPTGDPDPKKDPS